MPYAAGNLTAVAYASLDAAAAPAAVTTVLSAGAPAALKLTADRATVCASRDDLAYVTVEVVDKEGRLVPRAQLPLTFSVSAGGGGKSGGGKNKKGDSAAAAELYRVGNGDPRDLGSFTAPQRSTFRGKALAVLRPTKAGAAGQVKLSAKAAGLPMASVVVSVVADGATCA